MPTSRMSGRIASRPRVVNPPVHPGGRSAPETTVPSTAAPAETSPTLVAARRIGESVLIAAFASTGLYLVGTVYTDAYYGRLSIETTSLDLAPAYIALQSVHALSGLLQYPSILLIYALLLRLVRSSERARDWLERARRRAPRLLPVLANLAVVGPLLIVDLWLLVSLPDPALGSALNEVWDLLVIAGPALLIYAVWIGWSQRALMVSRIRAHAFVPIVLVAIVYVLTVLVQSAVTATVAAELLLTGMSDNAMLVAFTPKSSQTAPPAERELILVTKRSGAFYVVERQPFPPSERPTAYVISMSSVDRAETRRVNDAWSPLGAVLTAPTW
jgi:hypothetical protein